MTEHSDCFEMCLILQSTFTALRHISPTELGALYASAKMLS